MIMSQSYPLDVVIREVDREIRPVSEGETLVIIDVESKRAVPKKRMLKPARYFIVSNTLAGRNEAEWRTPFIPFKDFENNRSVAIQITYLAACEPGREGRIAEALFDGPHPAAVLNEKLRRWLTEYARQHPAGFIDHFFALQPQIQAYLNSKAQEEVGLRLSVKFDVGGADVHDRISIEPMRFEVRLKDCDQAQKLSVSGELRLDEHGKINAILHPYDPETLKLLVKRKIQDYFAETVSLQTFWAELNSGRVKPQLADYLNQALRPLGRRIGYISLASEMAAPNVKPVFKAAADVKPFFEDEIPVECKIKEYPHSVVVKNTVQMVLQDLAKYMAHGSPDLRDWNQKKLQQVISQRLLEKNCTELLLTFADVERSIKRVMDAEAEAIGYGFKQLITAPDLEALNWLEPFTLNVAGTYETKFTGFEVNLQVAVTAHIEDLGGIAFYVNRAKNVPGLMEKAIVDETKAFLHTVDPERFYTRFSHTDRNGERSIEEELKHIISAALVKQFHAHITSVTPKMGNTEITDKLKTLMERVCPFAVKVFLPDTPALLPAEFVGAFKVDGVDADGWYKFRQLKYDMAEIKQYLENYVSSEMDAYLRRAGSNGYPVKAPEDLIEGLAQNCTRKVYGLVISVSGVRRLHNELELEERQTQTSIYKKTLKAAEASFDALLAQLKKAEGILLKLIEEDAPAALLIEQRKKIASIRSELPSHATTSGGKLKPLPASRISGRASLSRPSETKRKRLAADSQSQEETPHEP
jgi:hypothetical protein